MEASKALRASWRVSELAQQAGCSVRTVYNWIREGRLRAVRAGPQTIFVLDEDWRTFLDQHANIEAPR